MNEIISAEGPFFYYDLNFKRIWLSKNGNNLQNEKKFGSFTLRNFPFGYYSAFVITDHCDFDTIPKLKAVFYGASNEKSKSYGKKGIVGSGLTLTKSVFSNAVGTKYLGLEDKNYFSFIRQLKNDGVEIAAHSLGPENCFSNFNKFFKSNFGAIKYFNPVTWIDHNYLNYNLTRFGWKNDSMFYSVSKLKEEGFNYFWSGIDYSLDSPSGSLNLLNASERAGINYLIDFINLLKKNYNSKKLLFFFFWNFIGDLIGCSAKDDFVMTLNNISRNIFKKNSDYFSKGPVERSLLRTINPFFYLSVFRNLFTPDEISSFISDLYQVSINNNIFCLFSSCRINDCVNSYLPENIDKLIGEKGLHIGHNYLCVEDSHYPNSNFQKIGDDYYINNKLQDNISYLSKKQKEGLLWVTTIEKLGSYFSYLSNIVIEELAENIILVKNIGNDKIQGLTFSYKFEISNPPIKILTDKILKVKRKRIGQEEYFWMDLPRNSKIKIVIQKQND